MSNNFVSFCTSLGLELDEDRYRLLSARSVKEPRIAVIGLVSRGKSTLVNQLVGESLCPVDARGETAALIFIRAGEPGASAYVERGANVPISPSPTGFRERLPRRVEPTVVRAEYSGSVRLPLGMSLVDTPGIDDAASVDEKLQYLEKHWVGSGATGALVVISVPVGMARTDYELVESAKSVFGTNFEIVLKAIDSTIEIEDLESIAEQIASKTGKRPLIVADGPKPGEWGMGDLREVESAIERLVKRSAEVLARSEAEIEDIHSLIVASIESGSFHSEKLESAAKAHPQLPEEIKRAVGKRLEEMAIEAKRREAQKLAEEEARRRIVLERQTQDLAKLLPNRTSDIDPRLHGPAVRDVFTIALEGGPGAAVIVRNLMTLSSEIRGHLGLDARQIFRKRPEEQWFSITGDCRFTVPEFVELLKKCTSKSESQVQKSLELGLRTLDQQQISILLDASRTVRLQAIILERFRNLVVSDFRATIHETSDLRGASNLLRESSRLLEEFPTLLRLPPDKAGSGNSVNFYSQVFNSLRGEALAKVQTILDECILEMQGSALTVTQAEVASLCSKAISLAKELEKGNASLGGKYVAIFKKEGQLRRWCHLCEEARADAVRRANNSNAWMRTIYVLSFVTWGVSLLSISSLEGGSVVLWLVSLVMWLSTRDRSPRPWQEFFEAPQLSKVLIEEPPKHLGHSNSSRRKGEKNTEVEHSRLRTNDTSASSVESVGEKSDRSSLFIVVGSVCALLSTQFGWARFSDLTGGFQTVSVSEFSLTGIFPIALVVAMSGTEILSRRGRLRDSWPFSPRAIATVGLVASALLLYRLLFNPISESGALQQFGIEVERDTGVYLGTFGVLLSSVGACLRVLRLRDA